MPLGTRAPVMPLSTLVFAEITVCSARTPASRIRSSTSRRCCGRASSDDRPAAAGPGGAAGAVQVVLRARRRVDVQHEADVVDVDAARGDISRDEHRHRAVAELVEHLRTGGLGLVAVQRRRQHALGAQRLGHAVRAVLRPDEEDRAAFAVRDVRGDVGLVVGRHDEHVVRHRGDARRGRRDRSDDRVVHVATDEHVDVSVERGREQQALPVASGSPRGTR